MEKEKYKTPIVWSYLPAIFSRGFLINSDITSKSKTKSF